MPVSRTSTVTVRARACAGRASALQRQDDLALVGELDRVGQQVEEDLAEPAGVADDRLGQLVAHRVGELEPFLAAVGAIRSRALSTHSRSSNGSDSRSTRPASIFEKSRMSLMIVRSASPDVRIVSA